MSERAAALARDIGVRREVFRARPLRKRLPRQLPPTAVVAEYFAMIRALLDRAKVLVAARLLPELPRIVERARLERGDGVRVDREDINKLVDQISEDYFNDLKVNEIEGRARGVAGRVTAWQRDQLRRQTRAAFGVDVFAAEPRLGGRVDDFVAENVALIKSVPNQYLDQVESAVTRGVRQGARHEDIAKEIEQRLGVAEDRAKLIARDQVLTLYADVNRARQEAMGLKRYVWRTVGDGRVRDEHEERDGQTFEWDDPPEDGAPGEAILCRCWAEPDLSDVIDRL